MAYRLAKSLETLRTQINAHWPKRSKVSDGWIGDPSHQSRNSDHNPWVKDGTMGVVTAFDITNDAELGPDLQKLVPLLVKDKRTKYVIFNKKIYNPAINSGAPRAYTGVNAHQHHLHLSVNPTKGHYDSTAPWALDPISVPVKPLPIKPAAPVSYHPLLKIGDDGADVQELQSKLNGHGASLVLDGGFGPKSEAALKSFQKASGLPETGSTDEATWKALEASPAPATPVASHDNASLGMIRFQLVHGWPERNAAAFIGRAQQEAYKEIRTGVEGDQGSAVGGWQWRGDRQVSLREFAKANGKPFTDWDTQIDFVVKELATSEKRAGLMLKQATTLEQACEAAMAYCRPFGFTWDNPRAGHGWVNTIRNATALMA